MDEVIDVLPGVRARRGDRFIRAVREADRVEGLSSQVLHVARGVVYVDVGADLLLLLHETEVPVGDAVVVEPLGRLRDGGVVEVADSEAVRDDPDPSTLLGELPQVPPSAWDHRGRLE